MCSRRPTAHRPPRREQGIRALSAGRNASARVQLSGDPLLARERRIRSAGAVFAIPGTRTPFEQALPGRLDRPGAGARPARPGAGAAGRPFTAGPAPPARVHRRDPLALDAILNCVKAGAVLGGPGGACGRPAPDRRRRGAGGWAERRPAPRDGRATAPPADFPLPSTGAAGQERRRFARLREPRRRARGPQRREHVPGLRRQLTWEQSDYDAIAAKGFNAVRFLLTWDELRAEPGRFQHLEQLDEAVRQARNAGLYVVMLNIIVDALEQPAGLGQGRDKLERIATGAQGMDPGARPPLPGRGRGGGLRSGCRTALQSTRTG